MRRLNKWNFSPTFSNTLLKTSIYLVPFLLATYILLELLEHKAGNKAAVLVRKAGIAGPFVGSLLGAVPQCGFSAAGSALYASRAITLGTLFAVFLSTSDEMLPLFIAEQVDPLIMLSIIGTKIAIGMIMGFAIDGALRLRVRSEVSMKRNVYVTLVMALVAPTRKIASTNTNMNTSMNTSVITDVSTITNMTPSTTSTSMGMPTTTTMDMSAKSESPAPMSIPSPAPIHTIIPFLAPAPWPSPHRDRARTALFSSSLPQSQLQRFRRIKQLERYPDKCA